MEERRTHIVAKVWLQNSFFFSNVAEAVRMTNALVHMVGPLKYSDMDDTGETLKYATQ